VLVTTLTKRMSEDLAEYFPRSGCAAVLHFGDRHARAHTDSARFAARRIRRADRINLLREGLIAGVSLVAILDADKEGFCVGGGADSDHRPGARHVEGHAFVSE